MILIWLNNVKFVNKPVCHEDSLCELCPAGDFALVPGEHHEGT